MTWFTTDNSGRYFTCLFFLVFGCTVWFSMFSSTQWQTLLLEETSEERKKLKILAKSIWPKEGENKDRIQLQIKIGYDLAEYIRKHDKPSNVSKKIILVPDPHYLYETFVVGDTFFKKNCPLTNCFMTNDIRKYKATADAIILLRFEDRYIKKFQPKPEKQIWIAALKEAPLHPRYARLTGANNLINWTYSARMESTLVFRHFLWRNVSSNVHTTGTLHKTNKAAWLVSNCRPRNKRGKYAAELQRYYPVEVFGRCGNSSCKHRGNVACMEEMLQKKHKFYLAFENTNCQEYITEKLYRTYLLADMVPIVMGAQQTDYAQIAPPHSYIHVDDFSGPQKLAEYLHILSNNDTEYEEYFKWKQNLRIEYYKDTSHFWCRLCALLNLQAITGYTHWYANFRNWWLKCGAHSARNAWYRWRPKSEM